MRLSAYAVGFALSPLGRYGLRVGFGYALAIRLSAYAFAAALWARHAAARIRAAVERMAARGVESHGAPPWKRTTDRLEIQA